MYLGDFVEDATVRFCWSTYSKNGASITRATDGTIKVRRLSDGTDCTGTSITDSEDTPGTGIHECKVDTSDNANFIVADDYLVWLDGGVVDGEAVNAVLAVFSIQNRSITVDTNGRVVLSAAGLDQIPVTQPTGVATTFREMVVQVWRRWFKKVVATDLGGGTGKIECHKDDDSVGTTQTVVEAAAVQTVGNAS